MRWEFSLQAPGGAAVGLEREWSGHASGPSARFTGIGTFTLLGLLAGLAGALWSAGVHTLWQWRRKVDGKKGKRYSNEIRPTTKTHLSMRIKSEPSTPQESIPTFHP